jgi:hypothetical protein
MGMFIILIFVAIPTLAPLMLLDSNEKKYKKFPRNLVISSKKKWHETIIFEISLVTFYSFLLNLPIFFLLNKKTFINVCIIVLGLVAILSFSLGAYWIVYRIISFFVMKFVQEPHELSLNLNIESFKAFYSWVTFILFAIYILAGLKLINQIGWFGVVIIFLILLIAILFSIYLQLRVLSREKTSLSKESLITKIFFSNLFIFIVFLSLLFAIGREKIVEIPFKQSGIGAKFVVIAMQRGTNKEIIAYFSPWVDTQNVIIDVMRPCGCDNFTEKIWKINLSLDIRVYRYLKIDTINHKDRIWYFNSLENCSKFCRYFKKQNPDYQLVVSPVLYAFFQQKANSPSSKSQRILKSGRQNQTPAQKHLKDPQGKQEKQALHN